MNKRTKVTENQKVCICTIFEGTKSFTGKSKLHPEDTEYFSEKRGLMLALSLIHI